MTKRILALLVLVAIGMAACPASYTLDNLAADSVTFAIDKNSSITSQTYDYAFARAFAASPSVALAVQEFSLNYVSAHGFAVYPAAVSTQALKLRFDFSAPIWAKLRVNFWASTHASLQLGFFKVGSVEVKDNFALVYTNLARAYPAGVKPALRIFLNGYDISSPRLQISVNPFDLTGTKLTIKVAVGPTTTLRRVWLSYVAIQPDATAFAYNVGQVSQKKFSGVVSSEVASTLYQTPYSLLGLSLLSLDGTQAVALGTSLDTTFTLTITSSRLVDEFLLHYVSLGVAPGKLCSACEKGFVASGSDCVATCPTSAYPFTYKDGGVACKTCNAKLGLVLSNGKCVTGSVTTVSTTKTILTTQGPINSVSVPATSNSYVPPATPTVTPTAAPTPISTISTVSTTSTTSTVATPVGSTSYGISSPSAPAAPAAQVTTTSTTTASTTQAVVCPENAISINGVDCVCDVGFVFISGKCQVPRIPTRPISVPPKNTISTPNAPAAPTTTTTTTTPSAPSNPTAPTTPTSTPASTTTSTTTSTTNTPKPTTATPAAPAAAVSNSSYGPATPATPSTPAATSSIVCGANSYDNGLGYCVCNTGFYLANGLCVSGVACGANAIKKADGSCACAPGFTNYNGICSKCPQGALWSSSANKCVYVCGQNSLYSTAASACVCNPGFGLLNNVCQQCPLNYFISNNYCVTCPLNAAYNSATKNCECASGFFTNQFGLCTRKCGTNEVYDASIQDCNCIKGLGRINGACQVCPAGSTPTADGSGCSNCKANEVLVNGQCLCQQGYAFNAARVCTLCSSIPNGFLVNGICSVCPGNTVYDGVSKCRCPAGKTAQGSRCISQCQADELLDDKGNCYTCGSNQVISAGKCVCASGYTLNDCGVCTLGCSGNQFAFRGACATCPLNTIYNPAINGCACPQGFYMNTYGICEKLILVPITCPDGQYFDSNNGCQACAASCKTCKNANTCLTCATRGYSANSAGNCVPTCGDGLLVGTEACDTGSTYSAGCTSCQITAGWTCSGQPSVCKNNLPTPAAPISNNNTTPAIGPTPTLPTAPVDSSAAPLYQSGTTNINSNNVFVTLKTSQTFTFANPTEMQSFIQTTFPSGPKPTVYCAQRNSPALDTFDCLLIYPSGVPNSKFSVNFSFNYQGKSGATTVSINPLATNSVRNTRKSN